MGMIVCMTLFFGYEKAQAKDLIVNTVDELQDAVFFGNESLTIKFGEQFPTEEDFSIVMNNDVKFVFDAENRKMKNKISIMYNWERNAEEEPQLVLKNFNFDGENKKQSGFLIMFQSAPGKNGPTDFDYSHIEITDSIFKNSTNATIEIAKTYSRFNEKNKITMKNNSIENNTTEYSGALRASEVDELQMLNNSFINNENTGFMNSGGAISLFDSGNTRIRNTVFKNNKMSESTTLSKGMGGGAIGIKHVFADAVEETSTLIEESIFEHNETSHSVEQFGGAIQLNRDSQKIDVDHELIVKKSTFSNNKASEGGGAISIVSNRFKEDGIHTTLTMDRSLFYKNSVSSPTSKVGGGALFLYGLGKEPQIDQTDLINRISSSTFYGNTANKNGGAAVIDGDYVQLDLLNNLFAANSGETLPNQFISRDATINHLDNIGLKDGETTEKLFGKYDVPLIENEGKLKAGSSNYEEKIPSISAIPRFTNDQNEATTGIGNENPIISNFTEDLRGYNEQLFLSFGAVESTSILYDANKGQFTQAELTKFDGKTYYVGKNPTQIAKTYFRNSTQKIADGVKDFKITRPGYRFIGWSDQVNPKTSNPAFAPGKSHKLAKQQKLYAVWAENKSTITYYGNGKTSGVNPKATKLAVSNTHTIKNAGSLKRKGYTFIGWHTKPSAIKNDVKYNPSKKITTNKNLKLYAIWKKNK